MADDLPKENVAGENVLAGPDDDPQLGLSGVVADDEFKRRSVRGGAANIFHS